MARDSTEWDPFWDPVTVVVDVLAGLAVVLVAYAVFGVALSGQTRVLLAAGVGWAATYGCRRVGLYGRGGSPS